GLGTILTPVFGLFFPLHVAVALTGGVHLANNLFKLALLGRQAARHLVLRFGLPSVLGGFLGAQVLVRLSHLAPLGTWHWGQAAFSITPLKLIIALLIIFFVAMERLPALSERRFAARFLTWGGLLSGFFGGLSGHQGALRSAFLVQAGFSKEQFVATGVAVACLVDLTRLPVYFTRFDAAGLYAQWPLLLAATVSAFAGAYLGARHLKKVTLGAVQTLTTAMLLLIALLLGLGVV
ncbi:MAG TPA: TSUP family transporter, partial [Saprospiraceae bacterium]|nr:TSUP family transporter [Saprospiraceae bacterium]